MDKFVKVVQIPVKSYTYYWVRKGHSRDTARKKLLDIDNKREILLNLSEIATAELTTLKALNKKKGFTEGWIIKDVKYPLASMAEIHEEDEAEWETDVPGGRSCFMHCISTNLVLNVVDVDQLLVVTPKSYAEIEKAVLAGESVI